MLGCGGSDCGCGCSPPRVMPPSPPVGMGGWFSTALNVAGSFVGDPALGDQIASQAKGGYAAISQTPQQIADTVAPKVISALKAPSSSPAKVTPAAQQVATYAAADIAQALAKQGYMFPAGTLGAEYQKPSMFNAFGGQNASFAKIGVGALGVLLLFKLIKG